MGTAPHAFAVSVEDQRGNIGEAVGDHRLAQPPLQPLDRQRRRDLADEPSRVGKAGLDRDPPARAGIVAIGFLGEQRVEEAAAMFKRAFRLEQGRNIDLVLDPEQPREIERGKHRAGLFTFGHQHPDRGIGVDVMEDLGHGQELADRSRILDRQRGDIAAQRLGFGQQFAHPHQRGLAGEIELAVGVDPAPDRVLQLAGIHPEMDPAHPQAIGPHRRRDSQQGLGLVIAGMGRLMLQLGDDPGQAGQLEGMIGAEVVGSVRQGRRIGEVGRCQPLRLGLRIARRSSQPLGDFGRRFGQRGGIAFKPLGLFRQAITQRSGPGNVGSPVHVVTDPGGEAQWHRGKGAPLVRPAPARLA